MADSSQIAQRTKRITYKTMPICEGGGGLFAAGGGLFAGGSFAAGLIAGGLFASGLNAAPRLVGSSQG